MSAIASIQNNTIYFEQFVRDQLKTQESEMRAELKDREIEIREMKAQKTMNDRIVEELRPLCEELPECALDPVTYEPIKTPLVMRCGHTLSSKTAGTLANAKGLKKYDKIPCPLCRTETIGACFIYEQSFEETVEHLEKITKIFKKTVKNNEAQPKKKTAALESQNEKKGIKKRKCSLR